MKLQTIIMALLTSLTAGAYDQLTTAKKGGIYKLVTPDNNGNIDLNDGDVVIFISKAKASVSSSSKTNKASTSTYNVSAMSGYKKDLETFSYYITDTQWNDNPLPQEIDFTSTEVNSESHPFEFILSQNPAGTGFALLHNSESETNTYYLTKYEKSAGILETSTPDYRWSFTNGRNNNFTGNVYVNYDNDLTKYLRTYQNHNFCCGGNGGEFAYVYKKVLENEVIKDEDRNIDLFFELADYLTLYYSKHDVKIPKGVIARTLKTRDDDQTQLTTTHLFNSEDIIPKGTGVVLKGKKGHTYKALLYSEKNSTAPALNVVNMLHGTDKKERPYIGEGDYYQLGIQNEIVLFYPFTSDFANNEHKAYLFLPANDSTEAPMSLIFDPLAPENAETAIQSPIGCSSNNGGRTYDINGMLTNGTATHGIKIINGKKHFR